MVGDDIGCVFGGPPCQGFSRAGRRRRDDDRNELVFEFMRVVCEIHPQAFCMENVPGIVDMVTHDGIPVIDAIARIAEDGGMGTFDAIRRSLAETAGVGAALRTTKVKASKRPPPGIPTDRVDVDGEPEQMTLEEAA
jgi:DNA (cytosine-5)-methyltransferase 1